MSGEVCNGVLGFDLDVNLEAIRCGTFGTDLESKKKIFNT